MSRRRFARTATLALAVRALAAPTATTVTSPEVMVVKVPKPSPSGGLDWGDAGIGAAGLLGLILLALGGTLAVAHRMQGRRRPASCGGGSEDDHAKNVAEDGDWKVEDYVGRAAP